MKLRKHIRALLNMLHLDLTRNLRYDRQTSIVMKKVLPRDANAIDVGCHRGEVLRQILRWAPRGNHFAFEPIPELYQLLKTRFGSRVTVMPYALSDYNGKTTFQMVKNAPAYSGLKNRRYGVQNPDIQVIDVDVRKLDDVIPVDLPINFIKVDVEGGEFDVFKGAEALLKRWKPVVVFECGLGASDFYGTRPGELYRFVTGVDGMQISTLSAFCRGDAPLTEAGFVDHYEKNTEYYFIAHPA